ncbi:tetratricopeptide repeat-containing sensor histidine kinase [uncultured Aquimarina sp.]|uniref:tetratricopeptide repeat-containing sensor histidine kinase n=1 Tax=uncultured Aquimarina sp. TaxID=575652 RepID=UPI00260DF2E0|nr:tetratricopeptide repeat-containing sensor histidine kinase [uncultured Aquimarina sp.]
MTPRKLLLLLFVFLATLTIRSQTKEEYCQQWHKAMDTIQNYEVAFKLCNYMIDKVDETCKTEIQISRGYMFLNQRNIDSSVYYLDKGIELAKKIDNQELLSSAYGKKAYNFALQNNKEKAEVLLKKTRKILVKYPESKHWILYHQTHAYLADIETDYEKALQHTDSTVILSERNNLIDYLPSCYGNRGTYFIRLSKYEKAVDSFLKAIEVLERDSKPSGLDMYYCMLATSYKRLDQYDTAIKYFKKAIKESDKTQNSYVRMITYSRMADAQRKLDLAREALNSVDSTLVIARKLNDKGFIADALHTKATIYFENIENYDQAEIYFEEAYQSVLKANSVKKMDDMMLISAIDGMAKISLKKKEYNKAKIYIDLLEKETDKSKILIFKKTLHYYKSDYYENLGESEKALVHLKKFHLINDSIANEEVKTKVADLEKKYDTKKKELAIVTLNKEKEEQQLVVQEAKNQQNLYLLAAGFLLLILGIGAWAFRKLRKQQKELVSTNQVKNRLFSIIAHDLRGMIIPFQRSGKILKYHIDKGNHEKTIELSQALEQNSESLSNMLDNLLNWSLEQMNGYKMNPEKILVSKQLNEIISGYNQQAVYKKTEINLKYQEDLWIDFDKGAFHVIFRNLIGNALKYTEEGSIRIEFTNQDDVFLCSVIDTGVGMSQDQLENLFTLEEKKSTIGTQGEKGTGLGLNLVYRFIKMHKGTIEVSSEKRIGTRFDLSMPITISLTKEEGAISKPLSA